MAGDIRADDDEKERRTSHDQREAMDTPGHRKS